MSLVLRKSFVWCLYCPSPVLWFAAKLSSCSLCRDATLDLNLQSPRRFIGSQKHYNFRGFHGELMKCHREIQTRAQPHGSWVEVLPRWWFCGFHKSAAMYLARPVKQTCMGFIGFPVLRALATGAGELYAQEGMVMLMTHSGTISCLPNHFSSLHRVL